ncbi:MAG: flagellar biosynthetic protein FliR [Desulfatirhabdiaceae bacterium]
MLSLTFPLAEIERYLFILLRVSSMTLMIPIFDSRNIPVMVKIGLCLSLALLVHQTLQPEPFVFIGELIPFIIGVSGEILVGAMMGLVIRILFASIQLAGELAAFQMGLTIANVIDPMTSTQVSIMSQIIYFAAILIFWCLDGHHLIIRVMVDSFRTIPPFGMNPSPGLFEFLMQRVVDMFVVGMRIGAPLIVSLLFATLVIGLVARTVPQMNVFMVAMPVKIFIGLVFLAISLPMMARLMAVLFSDIRRDLLTVISLF